MSFAVHIVWSSAQLIMALVGRLNFGIPPVAARCADCNVDLLVWPCYNCGGQFCGLCIFQHANVPGTDLTQVLEGSSKANEVSEGMHYHWRMVSRGWVVRQQLTLRRQQLKLMKRRRFFSAGRPAVTVCLVLCSAIGR